MNFLNEIAGRFPDAISLAAGRPFDEFYAVGDVEEYLDVYLTYLRAQGATEAAIRRMLLQYGPTNGQIGTLIAQMLAVDEGISVPAKSIMVTAGCQEAMIVTLRGLCVGPDDVILTAEPCYVGLTGAARVLGIPVVGVPETAKGLSARTVARVARQVRAGGRNPRALYVVPNFANPSGASMSLGERQRLLATAAQEGLLIIEDDPYGLFVGEGRPSLPTLKALDPDGVVIYLGSFAKSLFPGARVGFLVADQPVVGADGRHSLLAEELSVVKSMVTVNTSPIAQAVIGGALVGCGCSLRAANKDKITFYQRNMRQMLAAFECNFHGTDVTWNKPTGGFFAVLEVPLRVDEALLEISAREYGVLWTPMSFFYLDGGGSHAMRLSCSAVKPAQIDEAVRRVAALISGAKHEPAYPSALRQH